MSVLYHLMIPRPQTPILDAVVQEVESLRVHLGGEIVYLNPARRPGSLYPERLYGLHRLAYLRRREVTIQLHHIYNSHLFYFPYLRWLNRPVVYTVAAGLRTSECPAHLERLAALARIIVTNERDEAILGGWGLNNSEVARPGIDITRLVSQPVPSGPLTLLVGSAPWTRAQFVSKGVDALLAVARARLDLRLIFLWRGLLVDEMNRRVVAAGLSERVSVCNYHVDVNTVLEGVHASIVLASDETLVKAFPHSLLESLAAGRPVLISRSIPMADFVAQAGCGVVVERVDPPAVLAAVNELAARYQQYQTATLQLDRETFSLDQVKRTYTRIYHSVVEGVV
ncbi:MAG: glycosyltransferase [Chloroflexota bacterium]|nr:glycosyltransferase [Chloroflexota bacterium]